MSMIAIIGWIGTVGVLTSYFWSSRAERPLVFHWANLLLCIPVALPAMVGGAWSAAALSLTFGAIGGYGVLKHASMV